VRQRCTMLRSSRKRFPAWAKTHQALLKDLKQLHTALDAMEAAESGDESQKVLLGLYSRAPRAVWGTALSHGCGWRTVDICCV